MERTISDFITHHIYQREGCVLPAANPGLPPAEHPTRGQFTKCHKHLRLLLGGERGIITQNPPPSLLANSTQSHQLCGIRRGVGHTLGLGSVHSTQNSPLQSFLCAGVPYCSNVFCAQGLKYTCVSVSVWVPGKRS